ncbi:MAG: cyclodeaminase/cyclohydrolase family protein, partial [Planctomycetota bacterium]
GQFEKLKELIGRDPEREPDFGPRRIHPTAGATGVGARFFLIAYNVNLETQDVAIAKAIAKEVREKDGGLVGVKGMGFMLEEQKCAQVSMNLVDYRRTSPQRAYAEIERRARERGVEVRESELIGLVPRDAVDQCFREATKCTNFTPDSVIETRIDSLRTVFDAPQEFLDAIRSREPVPGGGSAAAVAGALGAALAAMVAGLTAGRKKFAAVEERMVRIRDRAGAILADLQGLAREDAAAFEAVMRAFKLPKENDAQKRARSDAIQAATRDAAAVPLRTAELCADVCELGAEVVESGNPNAITDGGGAALLGEAAGRLAADNVRINLGSIRDADFRTSAAARLDGCLERAARFAATARRRVEAALD